MLKQNNQEKKKAKALFFLCSEDSRWELSKPDKGDLTRNCGEGTSPRQGSVRPPPLLEQAAETWRDRRHLARLNTWSSANQARSSSVAIRIVIALFFFLSLFMCLCSFVAFVRVNEQLVWGRKISVFSLNFKGKPLQRAVWAGVVCCLECGALFLGGRGLSYAFIPDSGL